MPDPRIRLKNPWIAGVLGFLVPGLGHLYQGRLFKAVVYFCCILGLYITGMQMADWKAVYVHRPGNAPAKGKPHTLQFLAQAGVGLPAICALIQNKRYYKPDNKDATTLTAPLTGEFRGEWEPADGSEDVPVEGVLEVAPATGRFGNSLAGRFVGVDANGQSVEFELGERIELEEPINASRRRDIQVAVVQTNGDSSRVIGELEGSIPRQFQDWFVVPVNTKQERTLHEKLGKFHELAMVFTWVAGLLNILAVWDALEGPAYGYGDEEEEPAGEPSVSGSATGAKSGRTPAQATV
ncbi:MAG: hypothetical protein JNG89_03060 [Planctomycetaceae bacterium]|nr:hypothetical protein [Planctomycetaceae bacterium]